MLLRAAVIASLLTVVPVAPAQERDADYDNSVRLEYQFINTGDFDTDFGPLDVGETNTHALLLSGVYTLNERWKVYGSLPYVQKRHRGALPHDFTEFSEYIPPDLRLIDDGDYHGGLQDLVAGVQYLAFDSPSFSALPFISYGFPVSNYPIYGHASIGKQLWALPVGVAMEFTPYFSDWFFRADVAYVFSESVLGVDLDYWLMYGSASYYVTPRFAPRVFVTMRHAPNALNFPEDFSLDDMDNEFWYRHDQTLKHNSVDAGIGFDYIVSERHQVSATYFQSIDTEASAEVNYAFTFSLTRRF